MTDQEKIKIDLSEVDIDVIGEVMNISMGAAATAMSTILDTKVSITTPRIETIKIEGFEFSYLEPVIGVLIKYVGGIGGSNMLLLREDDLKKILCHLLSMEPKDLQEFDEISMSAICEIMNQMMGSAASALASFLGIAVNISPPEIMDTTNQTNVREIFAGKGDSLVSIKFNLNIDGVVESEFISAMEPRLVKEIVEMSFGANEVELEQKPISGEAEPIAAVTEPIPKMETQEPALVETAQAIKPQAHYMEQSSSQQVHAVPYTYKPLDTQEERSQGNGNESNFDLIMSVPIQITVELGKTRKKIKDIAELTLGNIVELDRQAGDQVDVVANGRLIARGDVVVVDDNYSVRITEIMKARDSFSELK